MAQHTDPQNAAAARLEELTGLYERSAYLIYNVALRVSGDDQAGQRAAKRAMLAQVTHPDPDRLPVDAARNAIEEAGPVDPRGVADPVLGATTRLSSPVRAALALATLAQLSDAAIGEALQVDAEAAADLRSRGFDSLAEFLQVPRPHAESAYQDLGWIDPPLELWEALYPELHADVARHARTAQSDASQAQAQAGPQARPAWAGVRGLLASVRRLPRWSLVIVLALAVAGIAMAATGGGDGSRDAADQPSLSTPSIEDDGTGYDALTPVELDKLRREELEDLERYTREQADKRLSTGERRDARAKAKDLVKLAKRRERAAARRELATRRALAAERLARLRAQEDAARERAARARQRAEEDQTSSSPTRDDSDDRPVRRPPRDRNEPDDDDSGSSESTTECVYDEQRGTYTCPQ